MTWKEAKSLKNVIFKLTIFKSNKNIEIHDWTHPSACCCTFFKGQNYIHTSPIPSSTIGCQNSQIEKKKQCKTKKLSM